MNKSAALFEFFNSFGLKAYPTTSVPDDVIFPYITYENTVSSFEDSDVMIAVNLYYYTESEAIPNAKAEEINQAIGPEGKPVKCDEGFIWIKRGSPFCQSLRDDTNPTIKRRYINLTLEYFTK